MLFRSRKAQEGGTNWIVITMVIALIVLVIYFVGPNKIISQASAYFGSCWGGKLVNPEEYGSGKAYDPSDWTEIQSDVPKISAKAEDKTKTCIIPNNDKAKQQLAQEENGGTQPGKGIQILVTLDDSITPLHDGQTVTLDAYRNYVLHLAINGELKNRICTFQFVDPNTAGKELYYFDPKVPQYQMSSIVPIQDPTLTLGLCDDMWGPKTFRLGEEYVNKPLQLQVIVHSEKLQYPSNKDLDASSLQTLSRQRIGDVAAAQLLVNIKTAPAVVIAFKPETWAQKAEVTLTCKTILCEEIILGTVYPDLTGKTEEQRADYLSQRKPQEECGKLMQNPAGKTTKLIHNLPSNANINTPNINPVEISLKPEKTNNKLGKTFTIDAETLQQDFGKKPLQTNLQEYLCFQVGFNLGPQSFDKIIKASDKPLLIDAQPPTFAKELVKVNYNTPNGIMTSQDKIDPKIGVSGTNLFIPSEACDDSGGSGCTRYYSYYTSINLNLPTAGGDPLQKIIGKVMGEAFNVLYTKSLSDSDCKPASDSSYKLLANYKPGNPALILINQPGLGYICVYPEDQAGNKGKPALIPYLNPYQLTAQAIS